MRLSIRTPALLLCTCLMAAAAFAQDPRAGARSARPAGTGGAQSQAFDASAESSEVRSSELESSETEPFETEPFETPLRGSDAADQAGSLGEHDPGGESASPLASSAAVPEEPRTFQKYTWDPRSGYGLCDRVCEQDEACVDGRCLARCSPDCRDGTYCTVSGECNLLPKAHADVQTEAELQTRFGQASKDATGAFFIDVAGVLFRGASLNLEWGKKESLRVRFSPMNTGLMNYFEQPGTVFERFEWGLAGALGYRHYEARFGNLRGFYYGGGLSYQVTEVRDLTNGRYALDVHYIGGFGEFGYRWAFGHFLFGFGPSLALHQPVFEARRGLSEDSCVFRDNCDPREGGLIFDGTMGIEIGWFP